MVDALFSNLDDIEADGAVDFPVCKIVARTVDIAGLPLFIHRLVGCAEVIGRARLDFYKAQNAVLLRYDINLAERTFEIAVQNLVAVTFQKLYRASLAPEAERTLLSVHCHLPVKLLR